MKLSERMRKRAAVNIPISGQRLYAWIDEVAQLEAENEALREAKRVVKEQSEDYGLWFLIATAPEGYLQQALRRLHAVIEG